MDTLSEIESQLDVSVSTPETLVSHLQMLSDAHYLAGEIYRACLVAFSSLKLSQKWFDDWNQAIILSRIGLISAARGIMDVSGYVLGRSLTMFRGMHSLAREGGLYQLMAQRQIWSGEPAAALLLAKQAWESAKSYNYERDFVRAARVQGTAALELGDWPQADERLHHALIRAREVNFVEEELPALIALAELRRRQGNLPAAREFLDDVWESAERGPYPLLAADAFNVLAHIERDAGNLAAAVEAATQAYRSAWCDGEPYAYHWGLVAARAHLREIGAPEPQLPPFDESKFEPMPEVEINLHDEFYVETTEDR
jgi:tetratricopeptide (TPR) repeat protein